MGVRRLVQLAALAAVSVLAGCGSAGAEPSEDRDAGSIAFEDPELGLSVEYPAGWHRADALTNVVMPRELVALATYPLQGGGQGGGPCAAKRDLDAIPPDGALIWLREYRPLRGDVWAELRRSNFPPRPERLEISREDLHPNSCTTGVGYAPRVSGLSYTTSFRDAERPLQLSLVFGSQVTEARLAEVERILETLRLGELPPPPPDPYARWPLLTDNPGDSLRTPPGWPAAGAMFPPGETPRPRPLFFTSNRPLNGLPSRLTPHVDRLPRPWPAEAIAEGFPADGVLLWVLEERPGADSEIFPPIARGWPSEEDLQPVSAPTEAHPGLRWLRAGGTWKGYRFSAWIVSGPEASAGDRALATKSAASLAVSGCWRNGVQDCPDS